MRLSRFYPFILAFTVIYSSGAYAQSQNELWINEIHYDNGGTDEGEFIEIVVHASFSDLANINITLYNGSSSSSQGLYDSFNFSEFTQGDSEGSVTFYYLDLPSNGIQNGSPDGISLDVNGSLIQFLSYEGTFTASDGPAQGVLSTDIGVEESSATEIGSSLSLTGTGTGYEDFSWIVTTTNSKGGNNFEQEIEATESTIDDPTISISVDGMLADSGAVIDFGSVLVGASAERVVEIKNLGNNKLWVSEISTSGTDFDAEYAISDSLGFNESINVTLSFEPQESGSQNGGLTISSNSVEDSVFILNMTGEGLSGNQILSIAEARSLPQGTIVAIAGIVTVAEEFAGPMYFQDETGGIAWYNNLMRDNNDQFLLDVSRGDSIIITGELGNYEDLIQIVESNETYEFKPNQVVVSPKAITVSEMNAGSYEGQLVAMNVNIDHSGALQGNTNYTISDETGSGQMRINTFSDIVGSTAPEGTSTVVGVVGIYRGTYQLLPRDLEDIDAEENEIPGEDISKDETFEVVTWNIEYFGQTGSGPEDDDIQLANAITVIDSIDADIYALQEISDQGYFDALIDSLEGYSGLLATFSQDQKTAYLYKTETVQLRGSRLVTSGMEYSDWAAGRYPYELHVDVTMNGEVREIYLYNIHAKAFSEESDYDQRINASQQMKSFLDDDRVDDNVIFLGDFNDEILQSTYQGIDSPYKNFDDDANYTIITKSLEQQGFTSYTSTSMIDHIVISSELADEYFESTERVENPSYVSSYLSQTSDHYPVWVRFQWGIGVSNEEETLPGSFSLAQNYPNPFNPNTQISYTLADASEVSLEVYDVMGRRVATLVQAQNQTSGEYSYAFNGSALASGVYIYQLTAGSQILTKKMLLVK